jgi:Holliday junction resolvase RusA-like endonuclease
MERFDFTVAGVPRVPKAHSKEAWKAQVAHAARDAWGVAAPVAAGDISIAIIYFYRTATNIDVDNIAKVIIDALKGIVLADDSIVTQAILRKTDQAETAEIDASTGVLERHFGVTKDFVYVVVADGPDHMRLPL